MESLNVMVVDDSMLAVQVLKSALEELGHKVVKTAGTGAAALAAYKACNPDVVTMDITMPDMDGIAATEKIVKSYPDARVIMVTSHGQQNMVMDALRVGAKGYILKPIKPDKLRDTLAKVIGLES
jgi:two-component system chemotaxis response regulator CheY